MEEPIKREAFLKQLEQDQIEFEGRKEEIDREIAELETGLGEFRSGLDDLGEDIQRATWASRLKTAAILVVFPIYILGESELFRDLLGLTGIFSALGLAAAIYCLAQFLLGGRIWLLAFGLVTAALIGGNGYHFYSSYYQGQAEELAWALNVPKERNYAFQLLVDKEYLRQQKVLDVRNIRADGECDFSGPTSRKPIHFAVASGDLEMMKLLLIDEHLSSNPGLGNALLLSAALSEKNSLSAMKMLLEAGVSPNHPDVVIKFILEDDAQKLQLLLDHHLDPDCSVRSEIIGISISAYKASKKHKAKKCRRLLRKAKRSRPSN